MFEKIRNTWRKLRRTIQINRKAKTIAQIANNPEDRLEFMRASYRKFSKDLTEIERHRMRKQIRMLERQIKNGIW